VTPRSVSGPRQGQVVSSHLDFISQSETPDPFLTLPRGEEGEPTKPPLSHEFQHREAAAVEPVSGEEADEEDREPARV
jgi:hypothetical protein